MLLPKALTRNPYDKAKCGGRGVVMHLIWGNTKPTLAQTDNKSLTRFFQAKHMAPSLWNHIDFILQFNFMIAHIPGKANQASDYISRTITDPENQMRMTINNRIPTYDVIIDGLQPNLASTDASPIDPKNVDKKIISSLMHIWQTSTNANAADSEDILENLLRICDSKELTVTCLCNLTTQGRSNVLAELSVPDPKREWYTNDTPVFMEAEQAKDKNITQVRECILRKNDINLDHAPTRLRKFVKQFRRLTVQNNVLYRKFFTPPPDSYPKTLREEAPLSNT